MYVFDPFKFVDYSELCSIHIELFVFKLSCGVLNHGRERRHSVVRRIPKGLREKVKLPLSQ